MAIQLLLPETVPIICLNKSLDRALIFYKKAVSVWRVKQLDFISTKRESP